MPERLGQDAGVASPRPRQPALPAPISTPWGNGRPEKALRPPRHGARREPCRVASSQEVQMASIKPTELGWKAQDFALKGVDGKTYGLADVRGHKGTLVAFICNHCPYVKAVIGRLADEAEALK